MWRGSVFTAGYGAGRGLGGQDRPFKILIRSEQIILLNTYIKTQRKVQLDAVKVSPRNL